MILERGWNVDTPIFWSILMIQIMSTSHSRHRDLEWRGPGTEKVRSKKGLLNRKMLIRTSGAKSEGRRNEEVWGLGQPILQMISRFIMKCRTITHSEQVWIKMMWRGSGLGVRKMFKFWNSIKGSLLGAQKLIPQQILRWVHWSRTDFHALGARWSPLARFWTENLSPESKFGDPVWKIFYIS